MRGDFSRDSHRPARHYTGVRFLQGRVVLDAALNEQLDIALDARRVALTDVIGAFGIPEAHATSLAVSLTGDELVIEPGVAYVLGHRVAWDGATFTVRGDDADPRLFVPTADGAAFEPRRYCVDLRLREELVTELAAPELAEPALLGIDHAARQRLSATVVFEEVGPDHTVCGAPRARRAPLGLRPVLVPDDPASGPCIVPSESGYRGLDNLHLRVEIHRGDATSLWVKWDRDNGSVEMTGSGSVQTRGSQLLLEGPFDPPHALERLAADDVLEVGGHLVRYAGPDEDGLGVLVSPLASEPFPAATDLDGPEPLHVRRWQGFVEVARGETFPLFAGVACVIDDDVLADGEEEATLAGAWWSFPVRAAIGDQGVGDVLWDARDGAGEPIAVAPHGPKELAVCIAALDVGVDGGASIEDCRPIFAPLTRIEATGGCETLVLRPEDDWAGALRAIPVGADARVCFAPGEYRTDTAITLTERGNLVFTGAGAGTRLLGLRTPTVLHFDQCGSATLRDLEVRGGDWPEPDARRTPGAVHVTGGGGVHFEACLFATNLAGARRAAVAVAFSGQPVLLLNNRVQSGRDADGLHLETAAGVPATGWIRIEGNSIELTRSSAGDGSSGIRSGGAERLTIARNDVRYVGSDAEAVDVGVEVRGSLGTSVQLLENVVTGGSMAIRLTQMGADPTRRLYRSVGNLFVGAARVAFDYRRGDGTALPVLEQHNVP